MTAGGQNKQRGAVTYRIGTDIGGTFTDLVLAGSDGSLRVKKVLTTPPEFERGVMEGIEALLRENGVRPQDVMQVAHATTVATNAVLERRGAKTGLITTRGFRDVLEIRRMRFPDMYNLAWNKPEPLADRHLRLEVDERMDAHGQVIVPLDTVQAESVLRHLVEKERVEALAVCLLNSYTNPLHENAIGEIAHQLYPELAVSLSASILPEIKEYERTSTTVINSYLMPVVRRYLYQLERALRELGIDAPLLVMQSSGGMMTVQSACLYPMYILESGPAAGVIGAAETIRPLGMRNAVTFDMGGTTAKSAMIEDGEPFYSSEYEVGAPISIASRLLKGGGYALQAPTIDVAEVGAGGGSIIHIDQGGGVRVGPHSAGASPGPVCYARGGTEPTVTDANLILGFLNPAALLGGKLPLDKPRAERALGRVADRIELSLHQTAYGVFEIANATMVRAIRAVSTERGRDIRNCALLVFGGNGPVHAAALAKSLEMKQVMVPMSPGVFSAAGLLNAQIERFYVETVPAAANQEVIAEIEAAYRKLEARANAEIAEEVGHAGTLELQRYAELRYKGQSHALRVPVRAKVFDAQAHAAVAQEFAREHARTYGHAHDSPVELVKLRLRARVPVSEAVFAKFEPQPVRSPQRRPVYFGPQHGLLETSVLTRGEIGGGVQGPAIIEEYDTTIVVPPGCAARVDGAGNVLIEIG